MTHPRDDEAAEFVLGTLPGPERDAFAAAMDEDRELAVAVRAWEERLAPLSMALPAAAPSPAVWAGITSRLGDTNIVPFLVGGREAELMRSRATWRAWAIGTGAVAAMLALFIAGERVWTRPSAVLVAAVNRSGDLPALLVRVDLGAGLVQVRSVAAETPAGRSLELWSVAAGQSPRSLGVVSGEATRLRLNAEAGELRGATIAVSVEPPGGSPTGSPTGPVIYSGKLVDDAP